MGRPVVHWEIAAKDAKKMHEFYSKLFGWNVNADNPMSYGIVNTGSEQGIHGGIFQGQGHTYTMFYVDVEDIDATLQQVHAMGGKIVLPKTPIPGGAVAQFADPEGQVIGLRQFQS